MAKNSHAAFFMDNSKGKETPTEEKERKSMALTRKLLSALGIEADKIEQIIDAHTETIDALKKERDGFKADAEKLPGVQEELKKAKEAAKNSGDAAKIQADFDAYKKDVEQKEAKRLKESALRAVAKDAGLTDKGIEKVVKYAAWDTIELDESGKIKDQTALIKSIKEEWPEHILKADVSGANPATPPAGNTPDGEKSTRAAQLYAQHRATLYGETNNNTKGESKCVS